MPGAGVDAAAIAARVASAQPTFLYTISPDSLVFPIRRAECSQSAGGRPTAWFNRRGNTPARSSVSSSFAPCSAVCGGPLEKVAIGERQEPDTDHSEDCITECQQGPNDCHGHGAWLRRKNPAGQDGAQYHDRDEAEEISPKQPPGIAPRRIPGSAE